MTTILSEIKFNALNPQVTEMDIKFGETFTQGAVLPNKYAMPYPYYSYQGSTPDCTAHGQAGASNENNGLEASKLNALPDARLIDPVELGNYGHSIGKITSEGGFINWAIPYFIKWGYITGSTVVAHDVTEMKKAILRTGALVTGSNTIPWGDFDTGWFAKYKANSPGHCFRIDGWDDDKQAFRAINSWGEGWGDGGKFWIRYSDVDKLLFTCYALHDKDDSSVILREKAKKLKIWDGSRPDDVATRKECVLIGSRISGKVGTDYDLVAIAKLNKVFDGTRENDKVSLFEAKIIFSRLNVQRSPNNVTRGELAECIN